MNLKGACLNLYTPHDVIHESGPRVPVPSDSHAFVHPVSGLRDDVVQLVGHSPGPGHIRNTPRSVQFRMQNIIHHPSRVADLETPRFDSAHCGWSDNRHVLLVGQFDEFTSLILGDTLGNDRYGAYLWELHGFDGALIGRT